MVRYTSTNIENRKRSVNKLIILTHEDNEMKTGKNKFPKTICHFPWAVYRR